MKHPNGIPYQTELQLMVERRVGGKAGTVIDLEQPRPELLVDQDVHPQQLEAHVVRVRIRLAGPVVVGESRLDATDRQQENRFYLGEGVGAEIIGFKLRFRFQNCC